MNDNQSSKRPKPKPVFKLGSPYTTSTLPEPNDEDEKIISDMLCNLLAPIGEHRAHRKLPTGVNRKQKRRRLACESASDGNIATQPPQIQSYLTVGLNSTTRHLEQLASEGIPPSLKCLPGIYPRPQSQTGQEPSLKHVEAVFLPQQTNDIVYAHMPVLSLTASNAHPKRARTRLVSLSADAELRLTKAMGLPRVGALGVIEGAPGAGPLIEFVKDHVQEVNVPWLSESSEYRDLQIQVTGNQDRSSGD